ncbi:MAG: 4-hydroxy-3-methylbut-2-enyl diphosphate reductase [Duodenibacillus sp.]
MQITLAQPRGFCAGVTRAIAIVERAIEVFGAPIYVRHEIVHNRTVVEQLKSRGAIFVDDLACVPEGATLIFSAHGVPQSVVREAESRHLRVFDATCPLVTKVHREVIKMRRNGRRLIMIGHAGHPEVEGTMGQVEDGIELIQSARDVAKLSDTGCGENLAFVSQTTLSVDDARGVIEALKARYPAIHEPKKSDVCYATQNRQDAVKRLASEVEVILVIGSVTSSNSNRLREVGEREGARAYLIDSAEDLQSSWFDNVSHVGITAGASAPEFLVQGVLAWMKDRFADVVVHEYEGSERAVQFPMPKGLWQSDVTSVVGEQA